MPTAALANKLAIFLNKAQTSWWQAAVEWIPWVKSKQRRLAHELLKQQTIIWRWKYLTAQLKTYQEKLAKAQSISQLKLLHEQWQVLQVQIYNTDIDLDESQCLTEIENVLNEEGEPIDGALEKILAKKSEIYTAYETVAATFQKDCQQKITNLKQTEKKLALILRKSSELASKIYLTSMYRVAKKAAIRAAKLRQKIYNKAQKIIGQRTAQSMQSDPGAKKTSTKVWRRVSDFNMQRIPDRGHPLRRYGREIVGGATTLIILYGEFTGSGLLVSIITASPGLTAMAGMMVANTIFFPANANDQTAQNTACLNIPGIGRLPLYVSPETWQQVIMVSMTVYSGSEFSHDEDTVRFKFFDSEANYFYGDGFYGQVGRGSILFVAAEAGYALAGKLLKKILKHNQLPNSLSFPIMLSIRSGVSGVQALQRYVDVLSTFEAPPCDYQALCEAYASHMKTIIRDVTHSGTGVYVGNVDTKSLSEWVNGVASSIVWPFSGNKPDASLLVPVSVEGPQVYCEATCISYQDMSDVTARCGVISFQPLRTTCESGTPITVRQRPLALPF